jgi:hypothetical protein
MDAFGAIAIKDNIGKPLDLHPIHLLMTRFINYCWAQDPPLYCGILAPWRHGKSTIAIIRTAAHFIGQNPEIRIRLVCADDREAVLRTSAIRRYILSPEYKLVYPTVAPARLSDWTKHQFFVERHALSQDPTLSAAGIFHTEAGGGNDLVMFDDIATYQNMILRPALREQVYDSLANVWLRRIDPHTRVLLVGTTWHYDDPYNQLRRHQLGQWRFLVVAISEDFKSMHCTVE